MHSMMVLRSTDTCSLANSSGTVVPDIRVNLCITRHGFSRQAVVTCKGFKKISNSHVSWRVMCGSVATREKDVSRWHIRCGEKTQIYINE
jgi:hypothetical protein